uniref:Protein kinase domain-containing protein n=1 Tax=Dendroctonus ponderosae TaxID=77166 RepID=A0AAR5PTW6_DENPD
MILKITKMAFNKSENYVWSARNVLGTGATSVVYLGTNKLTGDPVAVKRFKNNQLPLREFQILRKIEHKNVVKLLTIEYETLENFPVLITEFCNGNSLAGILQSPKYACGLGEQDFLSVLSDLTAGIKYLRENQIAHRDVKPGNIMRCLKDDGTAVYKLIDFGTARQLKEEDQFETLDCGTFEYVHPALYKRAILGEFDTGGCRPAVDLWSIGVTLYQVATGRIPFNPFGGRGAKTLMYKIITEKADGVISGVQNTPNGPIIYNSTLPESCQLSNGLQKIVTPLIAGLLEPDFAKIWSFETFFYEVDEILSRKVVNIFYVQNVSLINAYLKPNETLTDLRKLLYDQTELSPEKQMLFSRSAIVTGVDVPSTTKKDPMYLLSRVDTAIITPQITCPQWNGFDSKTDMDRNVHKPDFHKAMSSGTAGYQMERLIVKHCQQEKLIYKLINHLSNFMNRTFETLDYRAQHLRDKCKLLSFTADFIKHCLEVTNYSTTTTSRKDFQRILSESDRISQTIAKLHDKYVINNSNKEWNRISANLKLPTTTRLDTRANVLREQFQQNLDCLKKFDYFNAHTEYIIAKRQIEQILQKLKHILMSEVMTEHGLLCERFNEWYPSMQVDLLKIEILTNDFDEIRREVQKFEHALEPDQQHYKEYVNDLKIRGQQTYNLMSRRKNLNELLKENQKILTDWNELLGIFKNTVFL